MILALRTDQAEAEIHMYKSSAELVASKKWLADRQLTATLLETIQNLLFEHGATWMALEGVILYQGPGSFTGLRIGAAVANALSDSRQVPIVATKGRDWLARGLDRLQHGQNDHIALPEYGALANTTRPS